MRGRTSHRYSDATLVVSEIGGPDGTGLRGISDMDETRVMTFGFWAKCPACSHEVCLGVTGELHEDRTWHFDRMDARTFASFVCENCRSPYFPDWVAFEERMRAFSEKEALESR